MIELKWTLMDAYGCRAPQSSKPFAGPNAQRPFHAATPVPNRGNWCYSVLLGELETLFLNGLAASC
jgi:hypothetical protein